MQIENLATFPADTIFDTDVAIVGGGPAGLTVAREFFGTSTRVLVLESGLLNETPAHAALSELESLGEPRTAAQKQKRATFHGSSSPMWSPDQQPYGVRCRVLGGSSHVWAGKSAPFDLIDFTHRPWIPYSGWPIKYDDLQPFISRAIHVLNLSSTQPATRFNIDGLRSFYWQFARSRLDSLDIMRFGREFLTFKADNVCALLNATVTRIGLTADGGCLEKLDISTLGGVRSIVRAKVAVIAASGIENPRLLLASNSVHGHGLGNAHDQVGRFLMDHPGAKVGRFHHGAIAQIVEQFGFYGVKDRGRTHMFMHGLTLSPAIQEQERLVNCAIYFMPERSPDDPWDALKRLLRSRSDHPLRDMLSLVSGGNLLAKGASMKILASSRAPKALREFIVDTAIRYNPNFVADEFQSGGLPHKLTGVSMEAIVEQRPNPNSRVTLSNRVDQLGVPRAKVQWCIDNDDRFAILRIAQLARDILPRAGLPEPILEPWVAENRLEESIVIDMAHTLGTTRMSDDPKTGVVDRHCKVHGVHGLYIAGGSVFPTSGHANPTLMILSLAIRLADTIKSRL